MINFWSILVMQLRKSRNLCLARGVLLDNGVHPRWVPLIHITLFISISEFCGTDSSPRNIFVYSPYSHWIWGTYENVPWSIVSPTELWYGIESCHAPCVEFEPFNKDLEIKPLLATFWGLSKSNSVIGQDQLTRLLVEVCCVCVPLLCFRFSCQCWLVLEL